MADAGADVVKIETPGVGDDTHGWGPPLCCGEIAYFLAVNRGKRSLTLNLKHAEARRILRVLIDGADVVAENFRPGTMEKMGFGYDIVRGRNPRIVYAS